MLQPLFEWMQGTGLSQFFLNVTWASPIIQCLHLLALVMFSGALLIVDVRMLGRGLTRIPVAKLFRMTEPWLIAGFIGLLLTGVPQMFATALKEYYSPQFWIKMRFLGFGLVFTFTVRRWIALGGEERFGRVWPKLVALVSIGVWTVVAVYARLIGLFS